MQQLKSNSALRRALRLEGLSTQQHRQAVERIRAMHAHTIRFVTERADQTCATYALSLTDDPTYRAVAGRCDVYAGKAFMNWALGNAALREVEAGCSGDLVCYFSDSNWQHIGVLVGPDRVVSKWGTFPHYEHGLAEVTEDYGDRVRFYTRPPPAEALACFIGFAHSRGLSDADINWARRGLRE